MIRKKLPAATGVATTFTRTPSLPVPHGGSICIDRSAVLGGHRGGRAVPIPREGHRGHTRVASSRRHRRRGRRVVHRVSCLADATLTPTDLSRVFEEFEVLDIRVKRPCISAGLQARHEFREGLDGSELLHTDPHFVAHLLHYTVRGHPRIRRPRAEIVRRRPTRPHRVAYLKRIPAGQPSGGLPQARSGIWILLRSTRPCIPLRYRRAGGPRTR